MELMQKKVWFVTGSQDLYGEEPLQKVAAHSKRIVEELEESSYIPISVEFRSVFTTPGDISAMCSAANSDESCVGLILWMHTFSPARMWMEGLRKLQKPYAHLHTQFNREIPWSEIDMDFMNLNQSAHGGREFGYACSRMGHTRKVVVGHWQDESVQRQLDTWTRAAAAFDDAQGAGIARFGDNMRDVAVTEGDKVEAQQRFGYVVNGYSLGDLGEYISAVSSGEVERLLEEYEQCYTLADAAREGGEYRDALRESASVELGLKRFLEEGGFKGFTTTFENLHGLRQLPGLAVQRLMEQGYGFGAEGDWKTAALVRALKVMGCGLAGGSSFMEHYTYHLEQDNMKVLGAHMLEVCPSIAGDTPSLEVHPLDIGGKKPPPRLLFNAVPGSAINASIVDLGNRFRLVSNDVDVVEPEEPLPNLPVARALWQPQPDLKTEAGAWIVAGGAHHAGFSQAVTAEHLRNFAEMMDLEMVHIDEGTEFEEFKKELRWNAAYYNAR
mgnify:CR=1 FL=1